MHKYIYKKAFHCTTYWLTLRGAVLPRSSPRQHAFRSTSTMPLSYTPATTPKKKHTFLPFKDRLELIRKCEAGIAHSAVAAEMGVPRSTVPTIWKNRCGVTSLPVYSEVSG